VITLSPEGEGGQERIGNGSIKGTSERDQQKKDIEARVVGFVKVNNLKLSNAKIFRGTGGGSTGKTKCQFKNGNGRVLFPRA